MQNIFNKMTSRLKNALVAAEHSSRDFGSGQISTIHLLYGISLQKGGIGHEILSQAKLTPAALKKSLGIKNANKASAKTASLTPNAREAIGKAVHLAHRHRHHFIGTEHLLAGIISLQDSGAARLLSQIKTNTEDIRKHLQVVMASTSKFPDLAQAFGLGTPEGESNLPVIEQISGGQKTPTLNNFTTDLNKRAREQKIDPVIGRKGEVSRLISILNRRQKNNPMLIGEPGVGKTAIVEGLARKIVAGQVPDLLLNKKILNLDLALTVAGTVYRGEFEARLKQIIEEAKKSQEIILFIDELHHLIGTGNTGGSMDAAGILKPALARGEIQVIGATTLEEYKKYIEKDGALERRFQTVVVAEPTPEETLAILHGLKPRYEKYHGLTISNEALETAAKLSNRYITDRRLPDKAIDLVDEAASRLKVGSRTTDNREEQQQKNRLAKLSEAKQKSLWQEDYEQAIKIRRQELLLKKKLDKVAARPIITKIPRLTAPHIARLVAEITGVPLTNLDTGEARKLTSLEKNLNRRVIGQPEAVRAVTRSICRQRAGIGNPNRPIASFMFLGPSGVGKTELAKVIAQEIFGSDQALVRFDMSEFSEKFNVSRLIGAPAGYVGFEEGGRLTEKIKHKPYSVVLFDEIEKAHPDVFNILLQILEDGVLSDANSQKINFKNTVIVLTSNLGSADIIRQGRMGFSQKHDLAQYHLLKEKLNKKLKEEFRPELVNRLDQIIIFRSLTKADLKKIARLQIKDLAGRLHERDFAIKLDRKIPAFLADRSFDREQGARKIRRLVTDLIEDPLAQGIINGKFKTGDKIRVTTADRALELEKEA